MAKKKEKITYIDDGRTLADMSGVTGGFSHKSRPSWHPSPKFKDVWNTYWSVVKLMFKPMLVVMVGIGLIYVLMYILFSVI